MKYDTAAPRAEQKWSAVVSSPKKKAGVIIVVAVILIAVVLIVLSRTSQFAGKAIYTVSADPTVVVRNGNAIIQVQAGSRGLTGVSFNVAGIANLCSLTTTDLLGGMSAPNSFTCTNNVLHFDDALGWAGTAQQVKTGTVAILQIAGVSSGTFTFTNYEVLNGDDTYLASALSNLAVTVSGSSGTGTSQFTVSSSFVNNGVIPTINTCDTDNSAGAPTPSLTFSGIPAGTQSLVVIMEDSDNQVNNPSMEEGTSAGTHAAVHWAMVYNPVSGEIQNSGLTINSFDINNQPSNSEHLLIDSVLDSATGQMLRQAYSYGPPCPPADGQTHHYQFTVSALSTLITIGTAATIVPSSLGSSDDGVVTSLEFSTSQQTNILASATLTGTYARVTLQSSCGDNVVDTGEQCDDGNTVNGDGCSSTCRTETPNCPTCDSIETQFAARTQPQRVALCTQYGITVNQCPQTSGFSADINGDRIIDDRDALFIFQAIEAKQSKYNFCGANTQQPCVFGDRVICEDVSYLWSSAAGMTAPYPVLPTTASSLALGQRDPAVVCPIVMGGS